MASATNERYELIESIPPVVGDFVIEAYKVRETVPSHPESPAGRVVMLRRIKIEAMVPNVVAAGQHGRDFGRHPNVLASFGLVDIDTDGSIPRGAYIETEYARGISLRERIRRVAPFTLAITLEIAIAVAQALQFAAQKGIKHGSLTPEQVLLTPEGQVRVADFAVAAAIHEALGDAPPAPAEDLKALGAMIFEMLTAARPPAPTAEGLSPRALNINVPPAIDGIVRKATSTDLRIAYNSPAALLTDLQAAREDLRNNKPLNWTPIMQAAAATAAAAPPPQPSRPAAPKPAPGLLTQAAKELAEEGKKPAKPPAPEPAKTMRDPDYDYEPQGTPFVTHLLTALTIIVVVGLIGAAFVLSRMLTTPADVTVPDLVGKSMTDAQAIMTSKHLQLIEGDHEYNDTWQANTIYSQDPEPGRSIKIGKTVTVDVSDGPPQVTVPDVTGMTQARAQATLDSDGLVRGTVTGVYDDVNPKGIVVDQDPAGGSTSPHKTPVNISVSKGPSPPATPDGLSASATIQNEIDLSWNPVSNATTYNVYRDGVELVQGLVNPSYSDTKLGNDETHKYTVTAVNGNGESAQSTPVTATSLLPGGSAPAPVPAPIVVPPPDDNTPPPVESSPRLRQFHIQFRVPRHGDEHRVQIQTQDVTGPNTIYDEMKPAGSIVSTDVQGSGNKIVVRVFIDGHLMKQETL